MQTTNSSPTPSQAPVTHTVLPPAAPHRGKDKREGIKVIFSTLLILLMAPVLALSIVAFVFQSYVVDGPSMETTLQSNDRLIIWKVGKTWSRITKKTYIPERGSVVVFVKRGLYDFNSDREKQLIKRIIGLPGDRVVVADGIITVYSSENPEGFRPDETMEYGDFIKGETTGNADITLKADEVFVSGDHRDNSLDSRSFGAVPAKDIVGTLSLRLLPIGDARKF